jgi:hypothetical protein
LRTGENQRKINAKAIIVPAKPTTRIATMANIISLSHERASISRLFGVRRALMLCVSFPIYLLLAACLPVVIVGGLIIYLAYRSIHALTGGYPFSFTLRLGEHAEG